MKKFGTLTVTTDRNAVERAINALSSKELVDAYNAMSGSQIKKFRDRKTAVARTFEAALEQMGKLDDPNPRRRATDRSASEAIAASWQDPQVRQKRSARHHVRVLWKEKGSKRVDEFRSVRQAFQELQLPLNKHIKFRVQLKAEGKKEFEGFQFAIIDGPTEQNEA